MTPSEAPKVSVCMVTYNHERYVAQAIDSVLAQRVAFSIELLVGEDCSTDSTGRIVEEYQRRHPERVRLLRPLRNLGPGPNFIRVLNECRGQYVALLEGDDYWIDLDKLAAQVDFLDRNPSFFGCAVKTRELTDSGEGRVYPSHCPEVVSVHHLLGVNPFHTAAVVYRRIFPPLPEWYAELKVGDWPLHILHAQRGPFRLLDRVSAVYRRHGQSLWSSASAPNQCRKSLEMFDMLIQHLDPSLRADAMQGRNLISLTLAYNLAEAGDFAGAKAILRELPVFFGRWSNISFPARMGVVAAVRCPLILPLTQWILKRTRRR